MIAFAPPVRDKQDMYARLERGEFGNRNPAWYDLDGWMGHPLRAAYHLWGLRSVAGTGRRIDLDVPTADVPFVVRDHYRAGFHLTPMVDPWVVLRGNLFDAPEGLTLEAVDGRGEVKWRQAFADPNLVRSYTGGLVVWVKLSTVMTPSDLDDMRDLVERFPGHVVEFMTCSKFVGVLPHRNTVIWEVRVADGSYEKW